MRKTLALFAVVLTLGMSAISMDAEARRLGGGKSAGMQRQTTTAPASNTTAGGAPGAPTQQMAPAAGATAAAAAPAAAAAKRSWMGPVAGLAAGLGIAALASHFGFGEALANMLTIALIAMAVMLLIGFILRKRAASQGGALAGAGAAGNMGNVFRGGQQAQDVAFRSAEPAKGGSIIGSRIGGSTTPWVPASAGMTGSIPADFDKAGFERTAKDQFMALQAANDARDLDRLRDYLSPEMFDVVREEIAGRGQAVQKTEVFGLEAQVVDVADEADRYVVSVRFTGSIREEHGVAPEDLDEVWHLTKAKAGFGGWVIAGIQQAG